MRLRASLSPNAAVDLSSAGLCPLPLGRSLAHTPPPGPLPHPQVDNIRRSMAEDPVGLYVYDFDMSIDWGDDMHKARSVFIASITERDR